MKEKSGHSNSRSGKRTSRERATSLEQIAARLDALTPPDPNSAKAIGDYIHSALQLGEHFVSEFQIAPALRDEIFEQPRLRLHGASCLIEKHVLSGVRRDELDALCNILIAKVEIATLESA